MGFDANGTYTRKYGNDTWVGDATVGTKILANRHDENDTDMAKALSDCLNRRGQGAALANISMGGFKITNLLNPTGLQDAATYDVVKNIPGWDKSKYIGGADLDGRLNFTALSGVNGITWTYVDVSWIARHSVASKYGNRLAMNNTVAPNTTGDPVGDVFFIDDSGRINNSGAVVSHNLSYDGAAWRTISPGTATYVAYSSGNVRFASNDVASITNPYAAVTMREYFQAFNAAGSSYIALVKSASAKVSSIRGQNGSERRWEMFLGDEAAESSSRTGSNFRLVSYDNAGAAGVNALIIDRGTGLATLNGNVKITGTTTINSYLYSSDTDMIIQPANNGQVLIRADGTDTNHQSIFAATGSLTLCNGVAAAGGGMYAGAGMRQKQGSAGNYVAAWMNFWWTGSQFMAYHNTGQIQLQVAACDYRIKKDILPLPSVWDRVKALKPISYTQAAFGAWAEDSTPRWGFLAHEVADQISPAVDGEKDGQEVQGLNLLGVIAGLTKALQEAMERIEALEAAP